MTHSSQADSQAKPRSRIGRATRRRLACSGDSGSRDVAGDCPPRPSNQPK
ncbi:hypothetical protein [Lysobacter gummosus]